MDAELEEFFAWALQYAANLFVEVTLGLHPVPLLLEAK